MRKIYIMILMIFVTLTTVACDSFLVKLFTTTTEESNTIESDDEYITYSTSSIPEGYYPIYFRFDAFFLNPQYNPVINQLCFDLHIIDYEHSTSIYSLRTRNPSDSKSSMSIAHTFVLETTDSISNFCIEYESGHEVLISKDNLRNDSHLYEFCPEAYLIAEDSKASERMKIGDSRMTENTPDAIDFTVYPYLDFSFKCDDPNRLISSIKLVLVYEPENRIIGDKVIQITENLYKGDQLVVPNITIDILPPELSFTVKYYFAGNDGVNDFSDLYIGQETSTTPHYSVGGTTLDVRPGLWAFIYKIKIGENVSRVSIRYMNDGYYKYSDTSEPMTAELRIYTIRGKLVASFPIESGTDFVDIDNQYLDDTYILKITDARNSTVFSQFEISYFPDSSSWSATYDDQIVRIYIPEHLVVIKSIHILMTLETQNYPIVDVLLTSTDTGLHNISYRNGPDGLLQNYYTTMIITYIGFQGEAERTIILHE